MTIQARLGQDDEEGSMLLLTLGYLLLAIAVIFVCVCATDLYITQKNSTHSPTPPRSPEQTASP